ncbi:hypothetical protein MPLB_1270084 [Mesorhizobium sp. ORS 3324]|nr:hypothetical protein MPLB_1270084 [Mesorhizobium sp. ORS 3324]
MPATVSNEDCNGINRLERLSVILPVAAVLRALQRATAAATLERFTVSRKRRTALSPCFDAIPDGKPLTLFLELL